MKTLESLKKENGKVEFEGKTYIMLEQACLKYNSRLGDYYAAAAICTDDNADEDGCLPVYNVIWDIRESYDSATMEEDAACDWDAPSDVVSTGDSYDPVKERIY